MGEIINRNRKNPIFGLKLLIFTTFVVNLPEIWRF